MPYGFSAARQFENRYLFSFFFFTFLFLLFVFFLFRG